ncbi:MAG: DUF58 domain-containing protein [Bacteroidota bacterium]|nr:DUF58 domain-containing protein [Bacteroidota bacterium]
MLTTADIIKKVRELEIKSKRLASDLFSGEYHSAFKGKGMSFREVREYYPGDDIRFIDWNVSARFGHPYSKVFEEERELTIMLMVDVSPSVFFGTGEQWKNQWIAELCAVIGFSALQNNDKVGLILFSDKVEMYIPPKKGRQHLLRIIRELLYFEPAGKKTDINIPLAYVSNVIKKKCIAFIMSDFISGNFETTLRIAARRHDVVGIHVHDPAESMLPDAGIIRMQDAESGKMRLVDTSDPVVRHSFALAYADRLLDFKDQFKRNQSDVITLTTDQSYIQELHRFFKQRAN